MPRNSTWQKAVVLVTALFVVLVGCDSAGNSGPTIETIRWQPDGEGFIQLSTNDTEFYNYNFWVTYTDTEIPNPTTFAVQVKKMSGAENFTYGMIFDHKDDDNFARVMISLRGSYRVDKKENGEYSRLTGDTTNNGFQSSGGAITHGYDQTNTIRVVIDSTNNTLDLFINGVTVEEDLAYVPLGGDGVGGIATVGNEDDEAFPDTPVDVRVRVTEPFTEP